VKEPQALLVFVVCGVSDSLDGVLARWLRQRTLVGAYLDPVATSLMMATAFEIALEITDRRQKKRR
jgi:cardiolipin synthase